jgi:peptide/nickel transport system permease protein
MPGAAPRPGTPRPGPGGRRHHDLRRFLLQRLGTGVVLLVGITLVAFVVTHLVPGDPATIELALFAIVVSLVTGIGLGIVAAMFRDRWPDHLIRVISLAGVSMPVFWIALVAFYLLFFKLGWLPGGGRLDPTQSAPHHLTGMFTVDAALGGQWTLFWSALRHLLLPGLVLAIYTVGMLTRFTRASMLEIMGNDYVRAARLKGLPEHVVILRHVLRPALFVALVYIVVNLVVDLLYGVIDPRIRLS